jgi:hypothetical protein
MEMRSTVVPAAAGADGALDCPAKAAYEASMKSKKTLLTMCIGLVADEQEPNRPPRRLGDVTVEPYRSSKNKRFFKPTLPDLIGEVHRRFAVCRRSREKMFRPENNKGVTLLFAWLSKNPVTNPVDVMFLRREEHRYMKGLRDNNSRVFLSPVNDVPPPPPTSGEEEPFTKKQRRLSHDDHDDDNAASRNPQTTTTTTTIERPAAMGTVLAHPLAGAVVVPHPGAIPPLLPAPTPNGGMVVRTMTTTMRTKRNVVDKLASYELVSKMQGEILALTEKMGSIADPTLKALYAEIIAKTKQRCMAAEAAYDEYE